MRDSRSAHDIRDLRPADIGRIERDDEVAYTIVCWAGAAAPLRGRELGPTMPRLFSSRSCCKEWGGCVSERVGVVGVKTLQ
jgi:hypothetical protein